MSFIIFENDQVIGTRRIVIDKINAYGLTITEFNGDNDSPSRAVVWIETENNIHNKKMEYSEALKIIEILDDYFNEGFY